MCEPQVMAGIGPRRGRWIKWDGQVFCAARCYLGIKVLQEPLDMFQKTMDDLYSNVGLEIIVPNFGGICTSMMDGCRNLYCSEPSWLAVGTGTDSNTTNTSDIWAKLFAQMCSLQ